MTRPSIDDIEDAAAMMLDTVQALPQAADALPQIAECREKEGGKVRRRLLGRAAIRRYRRDTGEATFGRGKFRKWLETWINEHQGAINFARLIVSIISLLVFVI